jgi:hypothetical protein
MSYIFLKVFIKVSLSFKDQSLLKTRPSPTRSRKHQTRSPSPTQIVHQRVQSPTKNSPLINNKFRQKSPSSPIRRRHRIQEDQQELIRSSSCGDLPSTNFMHKKQTRFIIDQFVTHLTRIRTISKQIRTRNTNTVNGKNFPKKNFFSYFIHISRSGMLSFME